MCNTLPESENQIENGARCCICKVLVESQKFVSCIPEEGNSPDDKVVHVTCDTCFLEYLVHHERPQSMSIQVRCPAVVKPSLHTNCGGICCGAELTRLYNRNKRPGSVARFIIASNNNDQSETAIENIAKELLLQMHMKCPHCDTANLSEGKEAILYDCTGCKLNVCKICQTARPKGFFNKKHIRMSHGDNITTEMIQAALRPGRWSVLSHFMTTIPRDLRRNVVNAVSQELSEIDENLPRLAEAAIGFAFAPFQTPLMRRKMKQAAKKSNKRQEKRLREKELQEIMDDIQNNSMLHKQSLVDLPDSNEDDILEHAAQKSVLPRTQSFNFADLQSLAFCPSTSATSMMSRSSPSCSLSYVQNNSVSGRADSSRGMSLTWKGNVLQRLRRGSSRLVFTGRIGQNSGVDGASGDFDYDSVSDSTRESDYLGDEDHDLLPLADDPDLDLPLMTAQI